MPLDGIGKVNVDQDLQRNQFESTLDELADTNIRLALGTKTGRSWRRRAVWITAGAFSVLLFVVVVVTSRASNVMLILLALGAAVGLGIVFGFFYGTFYDWVYRRRLRRFLAEQLGTTPPFLCEIELRADGAWVRQNAVEMTFAWTDAT